MANKNPICFVIMPFRAELNYFYLFVSQYLKEKHGIHAERGDHAVLTKPLLEKVREQILASDVIIADVTGSNPNVFYELGLAHANGKPVIFLTQDNPAAAPVDIRQFELIPYDLGHHIEFLNRLDNAIQHVFKVTYEKYYAEASDLLRRLNRFAGREYAAAPLEDFQARVMRAERLGVEIKLLSEVAGAEFFLPKIIADTTDVQVMRKVEEWLRVEFAPKTQ